MPNAKRKKKAIDYKFDEDGSGHGVVKYSDGTSKRFALDIDTETDSEELPNTLDSVAKSRETYSPGFWKRLFNVADKLYIETVDEHFGVQKYLEKVGKRTDAAAIVNMARSSRGQAQTMIGSVQYDLFSGNYEELGEGIQEILAPIL